MADRIHQGLHWLAVEISATREQFRIAHGSDGDELLDGIVGLGYVRQGGGRVQLNDAGMARLDAGEVLA